MKLRQFEVSKPGKFHLRDYPTLNTDLFDNDDEAEARLAYLQSQLAHLQDMLSAQNQWSVLLILQGMDTAGKDGLIKHVMNGVNPQGCIVHSFKAPTHLEKDHDFLWRTHLRMPARGQIGIFNRSYYEDIIVPTVHPEILADSQIPEELRDSDKFMDHRCEDIINHELYLQRQGCLVIKIYLHLSKSEQKNRLQARLENPDKNWKFEEADIQERAHWKEYQKAYDYCIKRTSHAAAPWHIVPADKKLHARVITSEILVSMLQTIGLQYPQVSSERKRELKKIARELLHP
jgi:polyphosphate:nucleotide phosphotransferase, PPK2 family